MEAPGQQRYVPCLSASCTTVKMSLKIMNHKYFYNMLWYHSFVIRNTALPTTHAPRSRFVVFYCGLAVVSMVTSLQLGLYHDVVIKWKYFLRYWPFVRVIHRSPVNSPYKGQWSGAFMLSLICAWMNRWVNNREAGDLKRYRAHYDVIVMIKLVEATRASRHKKTPSYGCRNSHCKPKTV